jgi:hypothetical protein
MPVPATPPTPWAALEDLPSLTAIPAVWRKHLGASFDLFQKLYLALTDLQQASVPCPKNCGCWHYVTPGAPLLAHCTCDTPRCPPIPLTHSDITGLQLNLPKLARDLARALSLQSKYVPLWPEKTLQFGTWSPGQVPALLTVNTWRSEFSRWNRGSRRRGVR